MPGEARGIKGEDGMEEKMLGGQNSPWIILSILGVMIETIITMAVYTLVITKKYREN